MAKKQVKKIKSKTLKAHTDSTPPEISDENINAMLADIQEAEGFFLTYTTFVPDPRNPSNMLLKHKIIHNRFPAGDVLPTIKHLRELGIQILEQDDNRLKSVYLNEHVE